MRKMRFITIYSLLICLSMGLVLFPPCAGAVVLDANHATLVGTMGPPGTIEEGTDWFGVGVAGVGVQFKLGHTLGREKVRVEMDGKGRLSVEPNGDSGVLWFEGNSGTATVNQGVEFSAKYRVLYDDEVVLGGDIDLLTKKFRFTDSKNFTPYLLNTLITLEDSFPLQKVLELSEGIPFVLNVFARLNLQGKVTAGIKGESLMTSAHFYREQTIGPTGNLITETFPVNLGGCSLAVGIYEQRSQARYKAIYESTISGGVTVLGLDFDIVESDPFTVWIKEENPKIHVRGQGPINFCFCEFYEDADGDGHGNPYSAILACSQPDGYVDIGDDPDDTDASINPEALEICNGEDDDGDGLVDEGVTNSYFLDADGDGYGGLSSSVQACSQPDGYASSSQDCDDGAVEIHPGAVEIANGKDDDCDGVIDEDLGTYYRDADSDGYGDPNSTITAPSPPSGYVANGDDCNDRLASIHPGAEEVCNFRWDDDCDGEIDEGVGYQYYFDRDGDGYGNGEEPIILCERLSKTDPLYRLYRLNGRDCDDSNPLINPRATEVCENQVDDNCNGEIDEHCNPPVANNQSMTTDEDTAAFITLVGTEVDGDLLTYMVVAGPSHGTLSGTVPVLTYTPNENYNGGDSFTFKVNDGTFDSGIATVSLTVKPVNDPPVANAGPDQALDVGSDCVASVTLNGAGSYDVDGDTLTYQWAWNGSSTSGVNPEISLGTGDYEIALMVDDGSITSEPDIVLITADDRTPPEMSPPADVYAECTDFGGSQVDHVDMGAATVSDNCCTGAIMVEAPSFFPVGETPVTWTATDCYGNSSTATQIVTVQDTAPPSVETIADNLTVECDGAGNSAELNAWLSSQGGAVATDFCGNVIWTHNFSGLSDGPGATGTATVTFTATDESGNSATTTAVFSILDTTPPSLTVPANVTAECASPDGTAVEIGQAVASDACCVNVATITNDAPSVFPFGQTVVTWTADDCNGNRTGATQIVEVKDTTPPEFSVSVSPDTLWPPNHKMVEITALTEKSDICCDDSKITVEIFSVQMNEGDNENTFDPNFDLDLESGYMGGDIQIADGKLFLRAERSGKSDGRVYTIKFRATDCSGNSTTASTTVMVPHDQR